MNQQLQPNTAQNRVFTRSYIGPDYAHNDHRAALRFCIFWCAGLSIPIYLIFQNLIIPILVCTFFLFFYRDGFGKVVYRYSISNEKAECESYKKRSWFLLVFTRYLWVLMLIIGLGGAIAFNDPMALAGGVGMAFIQGLKVSRTDWEGRQHSIVDTLHNPWHWAYLDRPNQVIILRKPFNSPEEANFAILEDDNWDEDNPAKEGEDPCYEMITFYAQDEAQLDGVIALAKAMNPDFFTIDKNLCYPKGYWHTFKDCLFKRN